MFLERMETLRKWINRFIGSKEMVRFLSLFLFLFLFLTPFECVVVILGVM